MQRFKFNYDTYKWELEKTKFQKFLKKLTPYWWDNFWYTYHWNGIIGPGGYHTKSFKEGRLAIVLSTCAIILTGIIIIILIF